jgi:hypothetical protein
VRVLYVDAHAIHLNPTATYLPVLFQEAIGNVQFYGPGFIAEQNLASGLRHWIDVTGPYDVLVVGPNTPILVDDEQSAVEGAVAYVGRYTAQQTSRGILGAFFRDVQLALPVVDIPLKIVSALTFDYYAASAAQVEQVERNGLTVLGPNHQFILPLAKLPDFVRQEAHFQRKQHRLSDRWCEFITAHPERVVTALHFVAPHEFGFAPVADRVNRVAIPGASYFLRKEARRRLKSDGIRAVSNWRFHAYRIANRLGLPVY